MSTGFRAPTLAESYYSATNVSPTSAFVQLAPNSNAARLLGIDKLKPEKSKNYGLGVVAHPIEKMTATIDVYQINLKDRIFGSSSVYGTRNGVVVNSNVNAAIAANGNILDSTVTSTGINIFSNGLDTRTRGLDFVVSLPDGPGRHGSHRLDAERQLQQDQDHRGQGRPVGARHHQHGLPDWSRCCSPATPLLCWKRPRRSTRSASTASTPWARSRSA
ncbi:TonB-dependent receptor domain-containing protein [Caulobacter segnis]